MALKRSILLFLIQFCVRHVEPLPRHWDIKTTQGIVRGYHVSNPPHFAFLGVPYARPPTGNDRFKPPKPPVIWDGIFEATHKVKCPQAGEKGSENCLVLNIFIPDDNYLTNMPVTVHFHDGHFQSSWGSFYPPEYFLRQGIIVVTFNYRIGILGFLCLRSPEIPGNVGLKDQVAALYWIQRNIIKFNGNPHYITVYGTGSGSVSIEIILMSGIADSLFQKAILDSGSVLSPSSISHNPIELALETAQYLGYNGENDIKRLEDFFKQSSVLNLVNITTKFLPCIEKSSLFSFLSRDPLKQLKHGNFLHIPMLIVYGDAKELEVIENNNRFQTPPENFKYLLPNNLDIDTNLEDKVAKLTKAFYFGSTISHQDIIQSYIDYINDVFMEFPVVRSASFYTYNNSNPVYLMKFSHKSRNEINSKGNYGEVFQLVFTNAIDNIDNIADTLRSMWINFIKLGDPTPITTALIPDVWIPIEPTAITDGIINYNKVNYLEYNAKLRNRDHISTQQLIFWEHIYDKFYTPYS